MEIIVMGSYNIQYTIHLGLGNQVEAGSPFEIQNSCGKTVSFDKDSLWGKKYFGGYLTELRLSWTTQFGNPENWELALKSSNIIICKTFVPVIIHFCKLNRFRICDKWQQM